MAVDLETAVDAKALFDGWLERFGGALERRDAEQLADCFASDGWWKDILAFTWEFRTYGGSTVIAEEMAKSLVDVAPRGFRSATDRTAPRAVKRSARLVVEAFFDFDTAVGRGTGFVRLLPAEGTNDTRAWIVLTTLHELRGFEERIGDRRPTGIDYSVNFAGENWLDQRTRRQRFEDRDPEVLIIGGGQSGLMLGARLVAIGVDTLIIEKHSRIGDNWRERYHSLTLHNEVWANSLPYIPFPPTWPTFVPKDKLAGWLEAYAEAMELNVWTSTVLTDATYDDEVEHWSVTVATPEGSRTLQTPHLVLATGSVNGVPKTPAMSGIDDFEGDVLHSSAFVSGIPFAGRQAIVVGTGNSGHDVAEDLYSNGAEVTIMQRGSTTVVSLIPSGTMVYALYSEGPPIEDIDLITASIPYAVLRDAYQFLTKRTCELDRSLLDGLRAVGFKVDMGPDETGFHMKYLRHGGGYYINVGCAELIAEQKIGLVQVDDVDCFVAGGLRLRDGETVNADLVVFATGYENQQEGIRRLLGDEIADRVGPVWGFEGDEPMRNMYRRTAQPGLWLMGGSLAEGRFYSRHLALQLKAALEGQLPPQHGSGPSLAGNQP